MRSRTVTKAGVGLMLALGTLVPLEVKALPFETTPESFKNYVNSAGFDNSGEFNEFGSTPVNVFFYNPRECREGASIGSGEQVVGFYCTFDFKVESELGTRTCINYLIEYYYHPDDREILMTPTGWKGYRADNYQCSDWKKSVETTNLETNNEAKDSNGKIAKDYYSISINMYYLLGSLLASFYAGYLTSSLLRGTGKDNQ